MRHKLRSERKFDAALADLDAHGACFLDLGGGDAPAAPDYTPVAQASEAAARIGAEQADRVLAESKRQYDRNLEVAQPIIDAQTGMMKSAQKQGDDYYSYWKTNAQPVEGALNAEAMKAGTETAQQEKVDRAVADSQGGYTRALNQGLRQARRYGINPSNVGSMTVQQAANTAAAATGARDKEKALGVAKKLDVAGLYRGMPGASTGAYSAATAAGNSAVNNSTTVGNGMVAGTGAAAGLTMQGQGMKLGGLTNVANMQTSTYNADQNSSSSMGGLGSLLGGGASMLGAAKSLGWITSTKNAKTDKTPVSAELITKGLQRIPVEAWSYKEGEGDGGEHIGPYAEDVNREFGDRAAPGGEKIDLVSMNGLALAGIKSLADRMDKMENRVGMQRRD